MAFECGEKDLPAGFQPDRLVFSLSPFDSLVYGYYRLSYGDIVENLAEGEISLVISGELTAFGSGSVPSDSSTDFWRVIQGTSGCIPAVSGDAPRFSLIRVAALAPGKAMDSLMEPGSGGGHGEFSDGCWPLTLVACVLLDPWPFNAVGPPCPRALLSTSPSDTKLTHRLSA